MKKRSDNNKNGYTIIETMIAVSLFIVVVTIAMGALLNANAVHEKSRNMRSIIDNLSFIMEDMSRNLRMGYNYQCFRTGIDMTLSQSTLGAPRSCPNSINDGWALAFEYQKGNPATYNDQWVYYFKDGKIFKSINGAEAAKFVRLTSDEIVIDPISSFLVFGAEPPSLGDTRQPFVTIKLVGKITYKNVESPFSLQTSVSQRMIDI